jgi:hypothetical protein
VAKAIPGKRSFRGGRLTARDPWFGLKRHKDFSDFRDWWHRKGKNEFGGEDLKNRTEAEAAYDAWAAEGRPKAR